MKTLLHTLALGLALISSTAHAHGDAKPQHGGIVQTANDLQFELVPPAAPGGATALYISDHGKPVDASKLGGKLTVLQGTQTSEAVLKPAGALRLEAAGLSLAPKAKVVATVTGLAVPGAAATVRFSVK